MEIRFDIWSNLGEGEFGILRFGSVKFIWDEWNSVFFLWDDSDVRFYRGGDNVFEDRDIVFYGFLVFYTDCIGFS